MEQKIFLIIIGMTIVTYIPRALPLILLSKFELPGLFLRWLRYIPVAVMAALLSPILFLSEKGFSITISNKYLLAALPCFAVGIVTKNLFFTILIGILSMSLLNNFF